MEFVSYRSDPEIQPSRSNEVPDEDEEGEAVANDEDEELDAPAIESAKIKPAAGFPHESKIIDRMGSWKPDAAWN